jgi:hypothetical protein
MPPITALLHCADDALRLGRTLETLLPCNQILIVDYRSRDHTRRIAREYGAHFVAADKAAQAEADCRNLAQNDWILCLQPGESISESLQASLFEWSMLPSGEVVSTLPFSVFVREQSKDETWLELPQPVTRLVPRSWSRWRGWLPAHEPNAPTLEGKLLRFAAL